MSGIGVSFGFDRLYLVLEELDLFPVNINLNTELLFLNLGNPKGSSFAGSTSM